MSERPRIILHNDNTAPLGRMLLDRFPTADFREANSYAALPDLIGEYRPNIVYTVRFAGTPGYPRDALFGPEGPEWIANGGAGTDHLGHWDTERTTVTNAAGVAADMMAEYVFGCFLHFTLDVAGLQKDKAARQWNSRTVAPLSGKTLLIVGLGHTGRAIAKRAKAFGMKVLGTRARPRAMENVDEVFAADELLDQLHRADFIAVCTPLTPATRNLMSRQAFSEVKQGAILADVSRGGVVDQTALFDTLMSGHVAGAACDVFETEPLPVESALWAAENLIISPHCSSVHAGWETASFELFLHNLARWQKGEPLLNVVDPSLGY